MLPLSCLIYDDSYSQICFKHKALSAFVACFVAWVVDYGLFFFNITAFFLCVNTDFSQWFSQ